MQEKKKRVGGFLKPEAAANILIFNQNTTRQAAASS
jgi:hypothetical protein